MKIIKEGTITITADGQILVERFEVEDGNRSELEQVALERVQRAMKLADPPAIPTEHYTVVNPLKEANAQARQALKVLSPPTAPVPTIVDAAEMLWVVLANVSGGDWTQQSIEWQEAAARWRDNYFTVLNAASVPGTPTGTHAGFAALVERRVPEVFASGSDRDNAAKAWLHGYDTASRKQNIQLAAWSAWFQQRGLCSGCGIDRDHCQWSKKRGALACCPDCKHGEYATLDAPPTDAGVAALVERLLISDNGCQRYTTKSCFHFEPATWCVPCSLKRIMRDAAAALAQLQEARKEQLEFREWLWINHGCPVATLYGDDGEMQCGGGDHRVLDFKRDELGLIVRRLQQAAESQLTSLHAELDSAKADTEDSDDVRERLASLLTRTAIALRGEPEPLHLHDWSDLPKRVEVLIRELAEARRALDEAKAER